jgi:uncharacterized coiled-coil DUF342 family protein
MESERQRRHQFGLRSLFAVITIGALVALAVYAWQQRREASAASRRADQMAASFEAIERVAEQFNYEQTMFHHILGIRSMTIAEYNTVMVGLEDNPKAQKAVKEYETLAKSIGESLPRGQRSYPAIIAYLAAELRRRDQQVADQEDAMKSLREERDRFRQDADEYKTQCQALEKTINELRKS